jgi:hypothetical protein
LKGLSFFFAPLATPLPILLESMWKSPERPGKWVKVTRTFRDGTREDWWALEVITGPYGPEKPERVVIATTDPLTLPDLTTFSPFHQSVSARHASGSVEQPGRS